MVSIRFAREGFEHLRSGTDAQQSSANRDGTRWSAGGFAGVQLAVAGSPMGGPRTIVGLRVNNVGSDLSSVAPMLDDIKARTGTLPGTLLADANHATHACIEHAARCGVEALIAVPEHQQNVRVRIPSAEVAAWRERMKTAEARYAYRARASLCELTNAHLKTRFGLEHVLVRGTAKVTCVMLLASLAFNLLQHASTLLA